uniref:long-chain-fatty-acid--CoA ligase n=1 Tax=Acrobeloides nanus TaxID=290746 RepID=A0A914DBU0_9BILA
MPSAEVRASPKMVPCWATARSNWMARSPMFEWATIDRSVQIAHAFRTLGLEAGQNTFIGIYAKNRSNWIMVEHATYTFNNVLVPLYETFGAETCTFILNQAEIELVVCDAVEKAIGKYFVVDQSV